MRTTSFGLLRYAATVSLLAAIYVALAKGGLVFAIPPGSATAVWPAAGVAVVAILLLGFRAWPGVWLGSAFANLTTSVTYTTALTMATGNVIEAVLAAWLIGRYLNIAEAFSKVRDSFVLAAVAAGSCLIAAGTGATALYLNEFVRGADFWRNLWTWWLGDVASLMIVLPLAVACQQRRWRPLNGGGWLEIGLLVVCVAVVAQCIFGGWLPARYATNLVYVTMVLLIWVVLRFELLEVAASTLLLTAAAVWGTSHGVGAYPALHDSLFDLQLFMNVYALTGLAFAGVVAQRRAAAVAVLHAQDELRSETVERKRLEKWFRQLLDSSPDATLVAREDGAIVLVNTAVERLFGYTSGELIGQNIEILVPERHRERHAEHRVQYRASPRIRLMGSGVELSARRKNGNAFPVEIALGPVQADEGLFVFCSVRDITERKLGEKALRESQERFDLAVRGTSAGIWDWDLRSNVVFFSPLWKSMLGYSEREIQDDFAEWESRLHPDDRERALATVRHYLAGKQNEYELEHRLRHKDGTYRWILARGAAVRDAAGKVYRMVGSHLDITNLKRAEVSLRAREVQLLAAAEAQRLFLPQSPPTLPGFDIAGRCYPAEFAAGDHFEYGSLPDGSLLVSVVDVSGHGVGPAIVTASFHAWFQSLAEVTSDVAHIMQTLNRRLYAETAGEMFMTGIVGRIDPSLRTLSCLNAGHPSGYILDAAGAVKHKFDSDTVPLAVMPDLEFTSQASVTLAEDDVLFFFTDGVVEAQREDEPMFGVERALEVIRRNRQQSAAAIIEALYAAVRQHVGTSRTEDDVTVIVVKVGPKPS